MEQVRFTLLRAWKKAKDYADVDDVDVDVDVDVVVDVDVDDGC